MATLKCSKCLNNLTEGSCPLPYNYAWRRFVFPIVVCLLFSVVNRWRTLVALVQQMLTYSLSGQVSQKSEEQAGFLYVVVVGYAECQTSVIIEVGRFGILGVEKVYWEAQTVSWLKQQLRSRAQLPPLPPFAKSLNPSIHFLHSRCFQCATYMLLNI